MITLPSTRTVVRLQLWTEKNNNFIVWESGAILEYLVEKYDTDKKYSGKTVEENAIINQWLLFQVTGHSPVQGNLVFAKNYWKGAFNEETPRNVVVRFHTELLRVLDVYEKHLRGQAQKYGENKAWIALDHLTAADFSVIPWFISPLRFGDTLEVDTSKYPYVSNYIARATELPSFKRVASQLTY